MVAAKVKYWHGARRLAVVVVGWGGKKKKRGGRAIGCPCDCPKSA